MRPSHPTTRRAGRATFFRVALAMLPALLWTVGASLHADDRDLLRTGSGTKPELFILLDTSRSMNLKLGATEFSASAWTPGGADGPGSRLYQARQALYETFKDVTDVGFGFASMNQDHLHVVAKHWIYFSHTLLVDANAAWPINFPRADMQCSATGPPDCLTTMIDVPTEDTNGDGVLDNNDVGDGIPDTRITDVQGDVVTFGPYYTGPDFLVPGVAGTCSAPLDLDTTAGRVKAQTFANGATTATSTLWVKQNGQVYRLHVAMDDATQLGSDNMLVHYHLDHVTSCNTAPALPSFDTGYDLDLTMRLDPNLGETFFNDSTATGTGAHTPERDATVWEYQDVVSNSDFGADHPFTGKGWEGNYDSGDSYCDQSTDPDCGTFDTQIALVKADRYNAAACTDPANDASCEIKPVEHTVYSSLGHPLDEGDVIPFNWDDSQQADFLNRIAPLDSSGNRDFRGAPFFANQVNPTTLALPLLNTSVRPLLAADNTPLAKTYNDFRCWFMGDLGPQGKCADTAFSAAGGYLGLACLNDDDIGCRRFYAIVITDGESTANETKENPRGDNSDIFSQAGVLTWVLNVGRADGCKNALLQAMTNESRGEKCINVSSAAQLSFELHKILTQIREETRAFASAAVPSVQATVEQKIFLTSFTPLNNTSFWPGKVDAYLKPLPLVNDKPDPTIQCDTTTTQGCHLWDAGTVLLDQIPDSIATDADEASALGGGTNQRRIFYSTLSRPGNWWKHRRMFDPPPTDPTGVQARYDLWRGLGVVPADTPDGAFAGAETSYEDQTFTIIQKTLEEKMATVSSVDASGNPITINITYNLLDDFHSTPIVVGNPPSAFLYATDAAGNGTACGDTNGDGVPDNPGYRCFFAKHQDRRKVLILGTDAGLVEAFNAGIFHGDGTVGNTDGNDPITNRALDEEFDNGTGNELWAYMPRPLMPTVKQLADGFVQFYGADGTPVAADAFIDPTPDTTSGSPVPDPANRQWRTVVIGGFREAGADLAAAGVAGGRGYYALDITQPDTLNNKNIPQPASGWMPSCLGTPLDGTTSVADSAPASGCGPLPYPAALWEFTDSAVKTLLDGDGNAAGLTTVPLDEDGNGVPDLADTWSTPSIGRILVCDDAAGNCDRTSPDNANPYDPDSAGDLRVVSVAIFGGGMDKSSKATPTQTTASGNWLYMVDIETGQTIYKRELLGPAPSNAAAVDTNQDGYIDRIYIGTIAGLMYRVDLLDDTSGTGSLVPALESTTVQDIQGGSHDVMRITSSLWNPHVIFNTNYDDTTPLPDTEVRPIYYRPSVIFVARLGQYALAFGTGDREDLWNITGTEGRFYVFVDAQPPGGPYTILNEGSLQRFNVNSSPVSGDLLLDPTFNGWYLVLNPDERVITDAFALSGVTIFSAFEPTVQITGNSAAQACLGGGAGGGGGSTAVTCARLGTSNIYAVNTTNANGLLESLGTPGEQTRSITVSTFVSNPFAEPSATKKSGTGGEAGSTADQLDTRLTNIMNTLKGLFPKNCQFANYRIDVKTIAADTRLQFIAPVPVCIVEKNWKEY